MLKRFSEIKDLRLSTRDTEKMGVISDLLVDDEQWQTRYLVVTIHNSMANHKVLISPAAIAEIDFASQTIASILTSQQIFDSPPLDSNRPISRKYEQALVDYYGWPIYWLGRMVRSRNSLLKRAQSDTNDGLGNDDKPEIDRHDIEYDGIEYDGIDTETTGLRSAHEVSGYQINSRSGKAGYMKDLIINLETWQVEYATAESRSWIPGKGSMFSTSRITNIDWPRKQVQVDLDKNVITQGKNKAVQRIVPITGEPGSSAPFCDNHWKNCGNDHCGLDH